ncbi:MAG TPA: thiolase family protein [Deltaproteobacteria bacterium]|nr:thiolase family protein [Deltaproteobacteria bacterium]
MKEAVFVSAVRTPIGKYRGALKTVRIQDLTAHTMKAAVEKAQIDSGALDMSIYSQSIQSSLPANVGRHAWTLAGLSEDPAGYTLNTLCAGALQTMISGFNKIIGDEYNGVLVGGVESYSMTQYYIHHPRYEFGAGDLCFHDQKIEVETRAQPVELYGEVSAATLADRIALRYGLTRDSLDARTAQDHEKALAAQSQIGGIEPYLVKLRKQENLVDRDETPRSYTLEELAALPPQNEGGTATAASVAPWADAAASLVMLSRERAGELGAADPMAIMKGFGIAAGNPLMPEKMAIKSIMQACERCGLIPGDIDYFDVHTPSAAAGLVLEDLLGPAVAARMNVDGGSLAYGHPGAATGGIMMVNMLNRLRRTGGRYGLVSVGALGGQCLSIIVEAC